MRKKLALSISLLLLAVSGNCLAFGADSQAKEKAVSQDIVLRAMSDEMERTMKSLKLPDYPLPYFASYSVVDDELNQVSASFGAISTRANYKSRQPEVCVRVGDKHIDNTFFSPSYLGLGGDSFSLDDDYDAIRYGLWQQSDKVYKHAVESLQSVKSRLKLIKIEDAPDCFSDASPTVTLEEPAKNNTDMDKWSDIVRRVSAVFRDYPELKDSSCQLNSRSRTTRFLNSEGTVTRLGETGTLFSLSASAQAKDGMELSDNQVFASDTAAGLPDEAALADAARALAQRVIALTKAKPAEDYQGPILFEKEAAAQILASTIAPKLCARPEAGRLGGREERKLDKPLLAPSISVVDDPTVKTFNGEALKSGWHVDYEGVPAQKLTLVDKGLLKVVCSTRTPSSLSKASNGHNRGGLPSPGHLFLSSADKTSFDALKQKLIDIGKEEKLDSVLIVRRSNISLGFDTGIIGILMHLGRGGSMSSPCMAYKLDVKSAKEELIRGARISEPSKRSLLTMQAADDAHSYLVRYPTDRSSYTISAITPSLLFKDMEVAKPPQTTEVQPYLKNPYFEEQGK